MLYESFNSSYANVKSYRVIIIAIIIKIVVNLLVLHLQLINVIIGSSSTKA